MSSAVPLQNTAAKSPPPCTSAHRGLLLQRKCACGSPAQSMSGECAECQGKKLLRSPLAIGAPDDRFEQEADRVADAVVAGKKVPLPLSSVPLGGVQRQELVTVVKDKTDEEKYKEAGGKLREALLQTQLVQDLKKVIEQDKLVRGASEMGKKIAASVTSSLAGKVVTGDAAAAAVAALATQYKKLQHTELPAQIPEIPLDALVPGLSVQITYKGPMDQPTEASISFKFAEQASKSGGDKKDGPSEAEKYRAETARLAAADARFRAGMTYKPGSPEDLRQKEEQADVKRVVAKYAGGPDPDAMIKKYPGLKPTQPKSEMQLEMPKPTFRFTPPTMFGEQLKYKLPDEQKKKEDEPALHRKAAGPTTGSMENDDAPPVVHEALRSPGQPLDAATRAFMEPRLGRDFSMVRVHSGAAAAQAARDVNANAYTVGHQIVFGAEQFSPRTHEGRRLLAHELTHVVQQKGHVGLIQHKKKPPEGELMSSVLYSPEAEYKKFIADAASYGLPVQLLKRVQFDYNIIFGKNETTPSFKTLSLVKEDIDKLRDLAKGPKNEHRQGISNIYHESTHAFLDLMTDESQINLAVDKEKFQSFVAAGTKHYQGAPNDKGGTTTDASRVLHEAAAGYVANRVSGWWGAFTRLSNALALVGVADKKSLKAALNSIKRSYNENMSEMVFGYSDEGGVFGIGSAQVSTKRPMTLTMKYFLDEQLLENKIPDDFDQVKGFTRMLSDAKVSPGGE